MSFSIIIATYNCSDQIGETIRSVISQDCSTFEIIVVDGLSQDSTVEVVNSFKDERIRCFSEKDFGIYDAWNKGVRLAKYDWVCFLGAGDILLPSALSAYQKVIVPSSDINFVSSKVTLIKGTRKIRTVGRAYNENQMLKYMCVAHVGAMHKKNMLLDGALFSLEYKIVSDYEFFLRNSSAVRAKFLDEITVLMDVDGVSSKNIQVFKEVFSLKKQYSNNGTFYLYFWYFYSIFKWKIKTIFWY